MISSHLAAFPGCDALSNHRAGKITWNAFKLLKTFRLKRRADAVDAALIQGNAI